MTAKSSWRAAGDELLAAGPADRTDLIVAMIPHVPPNRASAQTRARREQSARQHGHTTYPQGLHATHGDQYEVGARSVAQGALNKALFDGAWIRLPGDRIALRGWSE